LSRSLRDYEDDALIAFKICSFSPFSTVSAVSKPTNL